MPRRFRLASGLMLSLLGACAIVAAALASGGSSTLGAAPALHATPAHYQYDNPIGHEGAERLTAECGATWGAPVPPGHAQVNFFVPDSPDAWPWWWPSEYGYSSRGIGEAVFTPSGQFSLICRGTQDSRVPARTVTETGTCYTVRSLLPPRREFRGDVHIRVTPTGDVLITCHGSFTGLFPSG